MKTELDPDAIRRTVRRLVEAAHEMDRRTFWPGFPTREDIAALEADIRLMGRYLSDLIDLTGP